MASARRTRSSIRIASNQLSPHLCSPEKLENAVAEALEESIDRSSAGQEGIKMETKPEDEGHDLEQKPVVLRKSAVRRRTPVYRCSQCPTTHLDRNLLLKHAADCHGRKTFECPICKNLYTNHPNLRRHVKTSHGDGGDDGTGAPSPQLLEGWIKCALCDMTFESMSQLLEHKKVTHNLKMFKCPYCPNEYTMQSNMARHRKSHGRDGHPTDLVKTGKGQGQLPRVYTTVKETTAGKKVKGSSAGVPTAVLEQLGGLDQSPAFVDGEGQGSSESGLEYQLVQMVTQLRIQKQHNYDKNISFFLHLNRYDPTSV